MLGDRIGECLPVTGRSMKVDEHRGVPARGESLRVPAPVPVILKAHLRAAVHDEGDRILPALVEPRWIHQIAIDLLVVPPRETELFELAEGASREDPGVCAGEFAPFAICG